MVDSNQFTIVPTCRDCSVSEIRNSIGWIRSRSSLKSSPFSKDEFEHVEAHYSDQII